MKKNIVTLTLTLFFLSFKSSAQTDLIYSWAKGLIGDIYEDQVNDIKKDVYGNVYITGYFYGTVDFDPGPGSCIKTGDYVGDAFVAKYTSNGEFVYAVQIHSSGAENSFALDVDNQENVYMTGTYQNLADFGGYSLTSDSRTSIFIAKYNKSGKLVYAKGLTGNAYTVDNVGYDIALYKNTLVISGTFHDVLDFDPSDSGVYEITADIFNTDGFIAKYDTSGAFVYAKQIGGGGYNSAEDLKSLALDVYGNIYISGTFNGTTDFDPSQNQFLITPNEMDGVIGRFFAKYDLSGNLLFAKSIDINWGSDFIYQPIAVDDSANIYIAGAFTGLVDFDPGPEVHKLSSYYGFFLAKYDKMGNYVFAKSFAGQGDNGTVNSITTDKSGNIYITGQFAGRYDFDLGPGIKYLETNGLYCDVFIAKYDILGNYVYAKRIGSTNYDAGNSISIDGNSNVYIAGHFDKTVDFDPNAGVQNITGNFDGFFAKYSEIACNKPIVTASINPQNVCPTKSVTLTSSPAVSYLWSTGATSQSIIVKTAGNFDVTVTNSNGCAAVSSNISITYQKSSNPSGLFVSNITNSTAKLNWLLDTCAYGYQYEWRKKGTGKWTTAQTASSAKTISGLIPNTIYQWRVIKAYRVNPDTVTSAYTFGPEFTTLTFTSTTNGSSVNIQNTTCKVTPNPATGNTILTRTDNGGTGIIKVTDINGKTVCQMNTSDKTVTIPSEQFTAGAYMITIVTDNKTETLKLIKQ